MWDSVWTVQDTTANTEIGDPQPEVEVGGNTSLFTRATDPLNPRCVAEILKHVSIGLDLSEEQQNKACNLIAEFADCFTLSVHKVLPIPGAEHHINIPVGITFPKRYLTNDPSWKHNVHTLVPPWMNYWQLTSLSPSDLRTLMRPHITYTHNKPCVTLVRHFCDDLGRFALKDDKGRQKGNTLRPFAMSYTILQYSTVLPFTFATFSNAFRPFATFLDFALFNTPPVCIAFSGMFHQTLFT